MSKVIHLEQRIAGNQYAWITIFVLVCFLLLCATGGELVDWAYLGFEIIMPFCITIMVCEWVRTLSDPIINLILVHSKSLFGWLIKRFFTIFGITFLLSIIGMIIMRIAIYEFKLSEIILVFFGTTFFLSSLGVLSSFISYRSHVSTCICGTFWLFCIIAKELIKYRVVTYIYPFIRFTDGKSNIWIKNKIILIGLGLLMWIIIYDICHKRRLKL